MNNPDFLLKNLLANDAWIRALARRLVADEHAADDLVQDAWIAAITKPHRKSIPLRSWLGRVVRNLGAMRHRSDANRRLREQAAAKPEVLPSVEELREREKARYRVAMNVLSLEEPYRSTVLYRYFENLPPREIAARLEVSVSAVHERLRRGLQKLRARLDRDFGDRRTWSIALMPLISQAPFQGAAVGSAASASILTGALIMSTKVKIGIAVIVALGVTYAFWPRDDEVQIPEVGTMKPALPVVVRAKKDEPTPVKGPEVAVKDAGKEQGGKLTPISLEPSRASIVGRVTKSDGTPVPGATVSALRFIPNATDLDVILSTKTDARGAYALSPIVDLCVVEVRHRDHYTVRRLTRPYRREDFVLGQAGVLEGRVLRARDGRPSADAVVVVYLRGDMDALHGAGSGRGHNWKRPPTATVKTASTGRYRVADLRPGPYYVRLVPFDAPQELEAANDIEIGAGQVTIRNLAVGCGLNVVGRVTDCKTRKPIVGAEVFHFGNPRHRTVTDENGRYELRNISSRSGQVVNARATGYTGLPSGNWLPPADLGGTVTYDIQMRPGVLLSGRVVGPDGQPVAGAQVGAHKDLFSSVSDAARTPAHREQTETNEAGEFEFTVRPTTEYRLFAMARGLAWGTADPFPLPASGRKTGIVVRLMRGGVVVGRITDETGAAVESAKITIYDERREQHTGKTFFRARKWAFSRAEGRYEIEGVPAGSYRLEVIPPGALGYGATRHSCALRDHVAVADGSRAQASFVLEVGSFIAGRVVDPGGQPIGGAIVRAYPNRDYHINPRRQPRKSRRYSTSDAKGWFRIEGLWTGDTLYSVLALAPGFDQVTLNRVEAGRTGLVLTLRHLRTLQGRVTAAATGRPIAEFRVSGAIVLGPGAIVPGPGATERRRAPGRVRRDFADLEGHFTLELLPGTYDIVAQARNGQSSQVHRIEVPAAGAVPSIEIQLQQGASIRGVARAEDGAAVVASVTAYDLSVHPAKHVSMTRAEKNGRFAFDSLSSGKLLFIAMGGKDDVYLAGAETVTLEAGVPREIVLTLRPGVEVEIGVTGSGGDIEGARVVIQRTDGAGDPLRRSSIRAQSALIDAEQRAGRFPSGKARLAVLSKDICPENSL